MEGGYDLREFSNNEDLDYILKYIINLTGCRMAGIRILDKKGFIPYEHYIGFPDCFWKQENCLSVDRDMCACIRVITGNYEPQDERVITPNGSFYWNNTNEFVKQLSKRERGRFRATCNKYGFLSVALIPLRTGEKIIGAIHVADYEPNKVGLDKVQLLELLAPLIVGTVQSASRIAIRKLKDSEEHFRTLIEYLPFFVLIHRDSKIVYVNSTFTEITGIMANEIIGTSIFDHTPIEYHKTIKARIVAAIEKDTGEPLLISTKLNGKPITLEMTTRNIRYKGKTARIVVGKDITQQKEMERKLVKSEKQYRDIVELAPEMIIICSKGNLKYINSTGIKKLNGTDINQFIGKPITDFLMPELLQGFEQNTNIIENETRWQIIEGTMNRLDGCCLDVEVSSSSILFKGKEARQFVIRNISERRQLEERKRRSERLESLGIMAAGIAHEMNQPLNSLRVIVDGTRYLCEMGAVKTDRIIKKKLDNMSLEISVIDKIVKYLYSLMKSEIELISCDLNTMIDEVLDIFKYRVISQGITFTKSYSKIPLIKASPVGLKKSLYNIIENSIHALAEKMDNNKEIICSTGISNYKVILSIIDNGPGISKKNKERIFDPFFTTKEPGKGTGLGLPTTHSNIQAMGGNIYFDPSYKKGAKFVLEFPIYAD